MPDRVKARPAGGGKSEKTLRQKTSSLTHRSSSLRMASFSFVSAPTNGRVGDAFDLQRGLSAAAGRRHRSLVSLVPRKFTVAETSARKCAYLSVPSEVFHMPGGRTLRGRHSCGYGDDIAVVFCGMTRLASHPMLRRAEFRKES
ncbi:MAG: hypothetical protein LBB65_06095 [Burkholderiales bacterium]|jgi:hypothetical protein|nr:hypothetical protein [Burkholderiales bacterium]